MRIFIAVLNVFVYIFSLFKKVSQFFQNRKDKAIQQQKKQYKKQLKKEKWALPIDLSLNKSGLSSSEHFAIELGSLAFAKAKPVTQRGELLSILKKEWGMSFAKDKNAKHRVAYALRHIWSTGSTPLLIHNQEFINHATVRDLIAYDTGLFVLQIHYSRVLQIIDSEEAWGMLFLNAQRAQDCYQSWDDFYQSYTRGLVCAKAIAKGKAPDDIKKIKEKLMRHTAYTAILKQASQQEWPEETLFSEFSVIPETSEEGV